MDCLATTGIYLHRTVVKPDDHIIASLELRLYLIVSLKPINHIVCFSYLFLKHSLQYLTKLGLDIVLMNMDPNHQYKLSYEIIV